MQAAYLASSESDTLLPEIVMPIQYQSPLRVTPDPTTVDGNVTLTVDILVTTGDLQSLDIDYIITDPTNAVFFTGGGKIERRTEAVSATQIRLVNQTQLVCGPGWHSPSIQIAVLISSDGVHQAPAIACGLSISRYSCAAAIGSIVGGHDMHAMTAGALVPMSGFSKAQKVKRRIEHKVRKTAKKKGGGSKAAGSQTNRSAGRKRGGKNG